MRESISTGENSADLSAMMVGAEQRVGSFCGTKGLLLAVLEDGIRSFLSPVQELRLEAEYWVYSGRAGSPFCFVIICETLELEPTAVRAALERLRVQRVDQTRILARTRPNVRRSHRVSQRQAG